MLRIKLSASILFQVRRWQHWDQKVGADEERPSFQKNGKKQVQFLKGEDGEPWVRIPNLFPYVGKN